MGAAGKADKGAKSVAERSMKAVANNDGGAPWRHLKPGWPPGADRIPKTRACGCKHYP